MQGGFSLFDKRKATQTPLFPLGQSCLLPSEFPPSSFPDPASGDGGIIARRLRRSSLISSPCLAETDRKEEEKEGEDKSQPRSIRDRRRPREKRRSTGVSFWTQDVRAGERLRASQKNVPALHHAVFLFARRGRRTTRSSSRTLKRAATRESRR